MLVREAVPLFLAWCGERVSPATLRFYETRIRWFAVAFADRELASIATDELHQALAAAGRFPNGKPKANDTLRGNAIAFERLQFWALDTSRLEKPICPKKLPKPSGRRREQNLEPEEIARLLRALPADVAPIFNALRLTGARPGELCRARIEDIDPRSGEIVLTEHKTARKTGRPRRIAIGHDSLIPILTAAIGGRTSGPIFLDRRGKPWTTERVSAAFRRARKKEGLRGDLVLYLTRHAFGTQIYRATGDIKAVADLLGHSQIGTTMRYTRVESETLKKNQRLFNDALPTLDPPSEDPPAKAA